MNRQATFAVLSTVFLASTWRQEAIAADTGGSESASVAIEVITVTARKRAESALEIPESVMAFDGSFIERNGIDGLTDIGNMVPNLFMSTRADGSPNVTIRGLGAFGNTQGVGFYLDDVQLFSDASSRFGDLERIEVLKGPQGILYGGSNIGGAVKFVSKRPDPQAFEGHAKVNVGEDAYRDAQLSLNIPLSSDWAVRIFGFGQSDDSFLINPNSPRRSGGMGRNDPHIGQKEEFGARLSLAGNITERFSLYASVRYDDFEGPNNFWIRELDPQFEYSYDLDTTFNPRHERDTTAGSLELVYDFDQFTVTSLTSYSETNGWRSVDADLSAEYILASELDERYNTTTQEFRFASTGSGPFQWIAGAYFMEYERQTLSDLLIGAAFGGGSPTIEQELAPPFALPYQNFEQQREQLAGFLNLSYRWNDIELAAGARVDRWETYRNNFDSGFTGTQSDTETLFRGSLSWFFDDDRSMLYGVISEGFEPGGYNLTNLSGATSLLGYSPETAVNFEVGYKGRLADDRVVVTLAAFLVDYNDRQFELQVDNPDGEGIVEGIINAGDSQQWGLEAELQWNVTREWNLSAGLGYLKAEWDNAVISPMSNADISGKTPPNTPELGATLALSYNRELNVDTTFFGRVQGQYKASTTTNSQFLDVPGDDFPVWDNPSYTIVNLSMGMSWRAWEFSVLVDNLLDEKYYVDAQEFPNFNFLILQSGIIIGTPERPRRYVGSISYRF